MHRVAAKVANVRRPVLASKVKDAAQQKRALDAAATSQQPKRAGNTASTRAPSGGADELVGSDEELSPLA